MYCVKFKDVFPFIKNGANIKQDANAGGIPITRIETLAGGEFNMSRLGYANIFDISPYYEYVLNSGDILMSHINSPEYLGRSVVFEDKYDIVIHGMNLLRLKANKEFIDSRYAVYLFNGNTFKEHIRKITKKSVNQASFSINDLKEIELQLPSIENQVIVAEKLDKLKMLIKKKNRLILFLDEMIKSRFVELFGDPVLNEKGWNITSLESVCQSIYGGGTPSKKIKEYYMGTIPWVTSKDMKSDVIVDSIEHITEVAIDNSSTKIIPPESVLIVIRSGILKHTLPVCINKSKVTINQDLKALVLDERCKAIYLQYLLKALEKDILSGVRAVTADNIEFNSLKKRKIPIPPINIQIEFSQMVNQINKLKSDVQKSIDETQLLMDSLMQEYFG